MKKAWKFFIALVAVLNIPVWSYIQRTKHAVWLGVPLSMFLSLPLLLWFVKHENYQKVEKILKEHGDNNSYLEQLCKLSKKFWWSPFYVRKALVQIAGSKDQSIECIVRAIDGLSISGHQAIKPLYNFLHNTDYDSRMRSVAAQGLSKFQIPEVEDVLIKAAFKDNHPSVVKAAISGLKNFPDSLPYLYRFIHHDDHQTRHTTMETICDIVKKVPAIEAIPPIKNALLNETENEISKIAIEILQYIGGKDALSVMNSVLNKWLTLDKLSPDVSIVTKISKAIAKLEETTRRAQ